jgi:serine/threonine protein kinase
VADPAIDLTPRREEQQYVAAPPDIGALVAGKYKLERILGQGGMGVVYAAQHVQLDQRVAIKFLLPHVASQHSGAVQRFVREARASARIRSEHVARVVDVSTENGVPYMVMEHLVGTDLGQVLKSFGALAVDDAVDYVLQACEALAEAHSLGIVHRDLKPSNIFVARRSDGTPVIKVLDFGIAKAPAGEAWAEGALTGTDGAIGSPMYMSPEHLRSTATVDQRTDVWSLGIILHELLTSRHPFEATSPGGMCVMIAADPPAALRRHRPDAPQELENVLLKCLEKDRNKRFQDVGELAAALAPFAHARSVIEIERILRVTASAVDTRPSGRLAPIVLPSLPTFSTEPGDQTQPSARQPVVTATPPPSVSEPPVANDDPPRSTARRRGLFAVLVPVALILISALFFVLRAKEPQPPAATFAAPPPPATTTEVAVAPPTPTPLVTTAAVTAEPVAPAPSITVAAKPTAAKPHLKPAAQSAPKPTAVAPIHTGAPLVDPTETRK